MFVSPSEAENVHRKPECGTTKSWQVWSSIMILTVPKLPHELLSNGGPSGGVVPRAQVGSASWAVFVRAKTNWDHLGSKVCKEKRGKGVNPWERGNSLFNIGLIGLISLHTIESNREKNVFERPNIQLHIYQMWRGAGNGGKVRLKGALCSFGKGILIRKESLVSTYTN